MFLMFLCQECFYCEDIDIILYYTMKHCLSSKLTQKEIEFVSKDL